MTSNSLSTACKIRDMQALCRYFITWYGFKFHKRIDKLSVVRPTKKNIYCIRDIYYNMETSICIINVPYNNIINEASIVTLYRILKKEYLEHSHPLKCSRVRVNAKQNIILKAIGASNDVHNIWHTSEYRWLISNVINTYIIRKEIRKNFAEQLLNM